MLESYSEDACKVGILSERIITGASGSADLIMDVMEILLQAAQDLNSVTSFEKIFATIQKTLTGSEVLRGQEANILFGAKLDDGPYLLAGLIAVDLTGRVSAEIQGVRVTREQRSQVFAGSGRRMVTGFSRLFKEREAGIQEHYIPMMLSFDFSNRLRFASNGEARGVGGAFLSVYLDQTGAHYPADTIYAFADAEAVLQSFFKVIYRRGFFLISDFIAPRLNIRPTLEGYLKMRSSVPRKRPDLSGEIQEVLKFKAQYMLFDDRDPLRPTNPRILMTHRQDGNVIDPLDFADCDFMGGPPFLIQGSKLTLSNPLGTKEYKVRGEYRPPPPRMRRK